MTRLAVVLLFLVIGAFVGSRVRAHGKPQLPATSTMVLHLPAPVRIRCAEHRIAQGDTTNHVQITAVGPDSAARLTWFTWDSTVATLRGPSLRVIPGKPGKTSLIATLPNGQRAVTFCVTVVPAERRA